MFYPSFFSFFSCPRRMQRQRLVLRYHFLASLLSQDTLGTTTVPSSLPFSNSARLLQQRAFSGGKPPSTPPPLVQPPPLVTPQQQSSSTATSGPQSTVSPPTGVDRAVLEHIRNLCISANGVVSEKNILFRLPVNWRDEVKIKHGGRNAMDGGCGIIELVNKFGRWYQLKARPNKTAGRREVELTEHDLIQGGNPAEFSKQFTRKQHERKKDIRMPTGEVVPYCKVCKLLLCSIDFEVHVQGKQHQSNLLKERIRDGKIGSALPADETPRQSMPLTKRRGLNVDD